MRSPLCGAGRQGHVAGAVGHGRATRWAEHTRAALAAALGRACSLCGVSLRQLERYFQSDYQCPPARWLSRERFRLARRLLDRTYSIKEVAYAVGFKNNAHFSTAFRREHGMSPSEYLKRRSQVATN